MFVAVGRNLFILTRLKRTVREPPLRDSLLC